MCVRRLNGRQTVYPWSYACWCVYDGWMGGKQCTIDHMSADVCTKAEWAANSVSLIICLLMCVRWLNGRQTVYHWSYVCWCVYEGWMGGKQCTIDQMPANVCTAQCAANSVPLIRCLQMCVRLNGRQTVYPWSDACLCVYGWMGVKQCTIDQMPADVCTAEWAANSVILIRCLLMYVRRLNGRQTVYPWSDACWCALNSVPLIRCLLMCVRLNGRQTVYHWSYACLYVYGWMGGRQCTLDQMPADVCTKAEWAANSVPLIRCLLMCVRLNGRQTVYPWSDACWCVYEGWMGGKQCILDQMPHSAASDQDLQCLQRFLCPKYLG